MGNRFFENSIWIGVVFLILLLSNYFTHELGKTFYKGEQANSKIFDVLWSVTPDMHEYGKYNDIIVIGLLISFLFVPTMIFKEFIGKFLLILLVRALTIVSTILPKHEKCDDNLSWLQMMKGQCYDKVFSGHTSFVLLATLIFLREGIISLPVFFALNLGQITSIILTRSHYTVDIILAIVITWLVYDGDYHVFDDFLKRLEKSV
jgi:hypothetical protein